MNERLSTMDHLGPDSPEGRLIGGVYVLEFPERAAATVPMNYLSRERPLPPVLILHGSRDRLVPFGQSVRLFDARRSLGQDTNSCKLVEADHGARSFARLRRWTCWRTLSSRIWRTVNHDETSGVVVCRSEVGVHKLRSQGEEASDGRYDVEA